MAENIEIKARVADLEALRRSVENISDTAGELIEQEDIFFRVPQGRLKLRRLAPDRGELIYYERPDQAGPKLSEYLLTRTTDPDMTQQVLTAALGVRGIVRKERWLYWVGNTRVHLDQVTDLGSFMELEVVLRPGETAEQGQLTAHELMERLGVRQADLIEGAYIDLLES